MKSYNNITDCVVEYEMLMFPYGRTIIKSNDKKMQAQPLHSKYIGA